MARPEERVRQISTRGAAELNPAGKQGEVNSTAVSLLAAEDRAAASSNYDWILAMANPAKLGQPNSKKPKMRRAWKVLRPRRSKDHSDKRQPPMQSCWQAPSAKA
jgi:hypothetical protein